MINSKRDVKSLRVAMRQSDDDGAEGARGEKGDTTRRRKRQRRIRTMEVVLSMEGSYRWGTKRKRKRKTGGRGPVVALNAATGLPPLVPQSSSSPFSLFFHA